MAYVRNNFNFEGVDWKQMVENSSEHKQSEEAGKPITDFGKSLLQICIDNESNDASGQF